MSSAASKTQSQPQFSLRYLFGLTTGMGILCGAALAWAAYLRRLESDSGHISLEMMHLTIALIMLLVTVVIGILIGLPLWLVVGWQRLRAANSATQKNRQAPLVAKEL